MFGEHKGDPCPCGYPDKEDMEIRNLRAALTELCDAIKPHISHEPADIFQAYHKAMKLLGY